MLLAIFTMPLISAITLTVNSPKEDLVNNRSVLIDLSSSETANFYYIRDISGPQNWILLCKESKSCMATVTLSGGLNKIGFKAVDMFGNSKIEKRSLNIDVSKPVISKISPNNNAFVNGDTKFNIAYSEESLDKIVLNYGTFLNSKTAVLDNCKSGKNQVCSKSLDLKDFDGQKITFSFTILDKAGNFISSRSNNVNVDVTSPKVKIDYTVNKKKVAFIFEVTENNFDKIKYLDSNEAKPVLRNLCSNLNVGRCYSNIALSYGKHKLTITTTDKAGNSDIQVKEITI